MGFELWMIPMGIIAAMLALFVSMVFGAAMSFEESDNGFMFFIAWFLEGVVIGFCAAIIVRLMG